MLQPILLFILGLVLFIIGGNLFVAYMALTVRKAIKSGEDDCKEDEPMGGVNTPPLALNLVKLAAGAAMIAFGVNLLIDNGTLLARAFGVPYRTTSVSRLEQPAVWPVKK